MAAAVIGAGFLVCCGFQAAYSAGESRVLVRSQESHVTSMLEVGQMIELRATPKPVTAYDWLLVSHEGSALEQVRSSAVPEQKGLPGGLMQRRFIFVARHTGCDVMHFVFAVGRQMAKTREDEFTARICVGPRKE